MLDALITGRLIGTPQKRVAKNGAPFAAARVRVPMHDGNVVLVSVSAFDPEPMAALLVLSDGEAVSINGPITLGAWTDPEGNMRQSVSMLAMNVLTSYLATKKKKAMPASLPVAIPGQTGTLF